MEGLEEAETREAISRRMDHHLQQLRAIVERLTEQCGSENRDGPSTLAGQLFGQRENTIGDRTILVKIHLEIYPISWGIMDKIFSEFGSIEYLEVFCPGEEFHSKIRFKSQESAIEALERINHRHVYDRCCLLELFLEADIDDGASKSESPNQTTLKDIAMEEPGTQTRGLAAVDELQDCQEEGEASCAEANQEIREGAKDLQIQYESSKGDHWKKPADPEINESIEEPQSRQEYCKVNSGPLEAVIIDVASNGKEELGYVLTEPIEIKLEGFRMNSIEILGNSVAHKVFVEMSGLVESSFAIAASIVKSRVQDGNLVFDPGISKICIELSKFLRNCVHTDLKGSKRYQFSVSDDSGGMDCEIDEDRAIGRKAWSDLLDYNIVDGVTLFSLKLNQGQPKLMPFGRGRIDFEKKNRDPIMVPFDRGKDSDNALYVQREFWKPTFSRKDVIILVFDPGGRFVFFFIQGEHY